MPSTSSSTSALRLALGNPSRTGRTLQNNLEDLRTAMRLLEPRRPGPLRTAKKTEPGPNTNQLTHSCVGYLAGIQNKSATPELVDIRSTVNEHVTELVLRRGEERAPFTRLDRLHRYSPRHCDHLLSLFASSSPTPLTRHHTQDTPRRPAQTHSHHP